MKKVKISLKNKEKIDNIEQMCYNMYALING